MPRIIAILVLCLPAACGATMAPEGRWAGSIQIPDRELPLVVDLAPDKGGAWAGSFIVPGLGIKGAPLANVAVTDSGVTFDTGALLASAPFGPATFSGHLTSADGMTGEMKQGGNVADFTLKRIGRAQVESAPRSTPVSAEVENQWTGDFELGGYPRHVTITFENHAEAGATAKFVVVGKQTTDLPVDLVIAEGDLLRVESQANQVAFEGRFSRERGEIKGIIELGPLELPLVLHRPAGRTS